MGDYTKTGVKIGTCGQSYYATKKMLQDQAHIGDPEINYYLDPSKGCNFAFPFPEYDGKKIGDITRFHEKTNFVIKLPSSMESLHGRISHYVHPVGGAGINLFIPCPYSEGSQHSHNLDQDEISFYLIGTGFYEGQEAILVECMYCGKTQYLSDTESIQAVQYLRRKAADLRKYSENEKRMHPDCSNWEYSLKEVKTIETVCDRIVEIYSTETVIK